MTLVQRIQPVNPATGEALDPVASTTPEELEQIVANSRVAAVGWGSTALEARIEAVQGFARRLGDRDLAERLARTVTTEMGKPIKHARAEVRVAATRTASFFERARRACADEVARERDIEVVTQWRPLGVVAVVAPWNFPVTTPHNLVASALLTGNTCILKPSEQTPRTGALYAEIMGADLPEGVLQVVQGAGQVGASLVEGDVDMIAFTGSITTGQAIMRAAAGGMKRLVLELGGKDPMIVLPGADLDKAATHAAQSALHNSGQVCVAAERILVHHEVHDDFLERVIEQVRSMKMGDPMDDATDLGPMASARQRELVLGQLDDARERGARVVLAGDERGPGFFLEPTILADVTPDMVISRDETFGPVLAVESVGSEDEALRRANDTRYGLGASVWGPEGEPTERVAARIEAGMVGVNRGLSAAAGAPWVGWKMSGFGYSRSVAGMQQFMVPRTISRNV